MGWEASGLEEITGAVEAFARGEFLELTGLEYHGLIDILGQIACILAWGGFVLKIAVGHNKGPDAKFATTFDAI